MATRDYVPVSRARFNEYLRLLVRDLLHTHDVRLSVSEEPAAAGVHGLITATLTRKEKVAAVFRITPVGIGVIDDRTHDKRFSKGVSARMFVSHPRNILNLLSAYRRHVQPMRFAARQMRLEQRRICKLANVLSPEAA